MIGDALAAGFVLVIIYLLVRPSSQASEFIQAFTKAMTVIVANAADLASPEETESQDGN